MCVSRSNEGIQNLNNPSQGQENMGTLYTRNSRAVAFTFVAANEVNLSTWGGSTRRGGLREIDRT